MVELLERETVLADLDAGDHELACRATDAHGHTQPDVPIWNLHGMGNNSIQRIPVTAR